MRNRMKIIAVLILLFICNNGRTQEKKIEKQLIINDIATKSAADIYWDTYPKYIGSSNVLQNAIDKSLNKNKEANSIIGKKYKEVYSMVLRDWGLNFWNKFPNDPRRFEWLKATSIFIPAYLKNIDETINSLDSVGIVDTVARNKWEREYNKLLQDVLSTTQLKPKEKMDLFGMKFKSVYNRRFRSDQNAKFNISQWTNEAITYLKTYADNFPNDSSIEIKRILNEAKWFFKQTKAFGLDDDDLRGLIMCFEDSGNMEFQNFIQSMNSLLMLKNKAISIKTKDVNGLPFDLRKYRGKVVLLDFWGLGCTSCISKMPEIRDVWNKYRDKGFEVISMCLVGYEYTNGHWDQKKFMFSRLEKDKPKIQEIHKRFGANWPLVLLDFRPGKLGSEIFKEYNFSGVPQLLLLDEYGLLIEYNGDMFTKGGLEKLVAAQLNNKTKRL